MESARETVPVRASCRHHALVLTGLWLLYPRVIGLSSDGAGVTGPLFGVAPIAVIDVAAKVGCRFVSALPHARVTEEERRDITGRPLRPASQSGRDPAGHAARGSRRTSRAPVTRPPSSRRFSATRLPRSASAIWRLIDRPSPEC